MEVDQGQGPGVGKGAWDDLYDATDDEADEPDNKADEDESDKSDERDDKADERDDESDADSTGAEPKSPPLYGSMAASFSATSWGGERVWHALEATVESARLAGEYIQDHAHRMGTGQWGMANVMADATLRMARATAASDSISPWTATDARDQALETRISAERTLRYIETQVGGGPRQWRRAAALASGTVEMAVEAEEHIEEAVKNGWGRE
jgi:hypothetical protein